MRRPIQFLLIVSLAVSMGVSCSEAPQESREVRYDAPALPGYGPDPGYSSGLHVAVVTGGHAFDVLNFHRLLRQLPGVDAYPQHIEHFASSPEEVRDSYDAIVFYGIDQGLPYEEGRRAGGNAKAAIERLVDQGQGIVVLHHALLAWEKWDFWNQLIGFDNRNFKYKEGLELKIEIGEADHPITQGMEEFSIVDEGYVLHGEYDGKGDVLLTTEHENAMEHVAWAREEDKCRVVCLALGHDNEAWSNPVFRTILANGIKWSAGETAGTGE